jgi:adenylosuccinate synthase
MPTVVLIGAQWGDEGKGKISDVLAAEADVMARFNGGNNAGHTVVAGGEKIVLRLVPVGILRPAVRCYIGRGVVVNPAYLLEELDRLAASGVAADHLMIDWHCHLILPYHIELDQAGDAALGDRRVGTTGRGIGPCYADKATRLGIRFADLYDDDASLRDKVSALASRYEPLLAKLGAKVDINDVLEGLKAAAPRLKKYGGDVAREMRAEIATGAKVLLEGAHGLLLDIDYGTYPYVTSSSCHPASAYLSLGLPPAGFDNVVGIAKAYQTRVGEGPMPTELNDETGAFMQKRGNEYGATTGRPRRCGWLDLAMLRYAVETAGIKMLALNKLDVLDGLPALKVGVGYEVGKGKYDYLLPPMDHLACAKPIYQELPGWEGSVAAARSYEELPAAARAYVEFIERWVGVPVAFLSTGPGREEGFMRRPAFG